MQIVPHLTPTPPASLLEKADEEGSMEDNDDLADLDSIEKLLGKELYVTVRCGPDYVGDDPVMPARMCACVCVCLYVCMFMCVRVFIWVWVRVCMRICVCA